MFKKILNVFKNKYKLYETTLLFDEPIPSCKIDSLLYEDKNWKFCYKVNSPIDLNDNTENLNLAIYGHISDLELIKRDTLHEKSCNIKINSLNDYIKYLTLQIEADKKYREEFMKKIEYNNELKNNLQLNVVELSNKNYSNEELQKMRITYIAGIYDQNEHNTIFKAV